MPDGKPENQFAFNGEAKNAAFANNIVNEVHKFWKGLVNKEIDGGSISCTNTMVEGAPDMVTTDAAEEIITKSTDGGEPQEVGDTSE